MLWLDLYSAKFTAFYHTANLLHKLTISIVLADQL